MSPYRQVDPQPEPASTIRGTAWPLSSLVLALGIGQMAWVVARHQPWGPEATLALLAAVISGGALLDALRGGPRRTS